MWLHFEETDTYEIACLLHVMDNLLDFSQSNLLWDILAPWHFPRKKEFCARWTWKTPLPVDKCKKLSLIAASFRPLCVSLVLNLKLYNAAFSRLQFIWLQIPFFLLLQCLMLLGVQEIQRYKHKPVMKFTSVINYNFYSFLYTHNL